MTVPGLMIAAPASGSGKTTLTLGLIRALRDRGLRVQPFKNGPDYIDPEFHRRAGGRPSYNLDTWAMAPALLDGLARHAADADLIVAEGSMGLFDGVASNGATGTGSSAETAVRFGWSVLLVLDVRGQAQSAAATALGYREHPDAPPLAGVVLNRVASERHARLARRGLERVGIPVLGVLPRRPDLSLPERHLGLLQAAEQADVEEKIAGYAEFVRAHVDVEAIIDAATGELPAATDPAVPLEVVGSRIAIARDEAFSFVYPHVLDGWRASGAQLLPFSPLADEAPDPSADLVWLPGGYPELHASRIAAASGFREGMRDLAARGCPIHGECGGYMVLGEALIDANGERHPMLGLLGLVTSYAKRKLHLGYRVASLEEPPLALPGAGVLRGHEFRYSRVVETRDAPLAHVSDANGTPVAETGSRRGSVSGSFFHAVSTATKS
ncbi:MAG: cobyrinate a,c-diamide synthase [Myxococcota bacterium]